MKFADDWMHPAALWCWERPPYQLSHSHCQYVFRDDISLEEIIQAIPCINETLGLGKLFKFHKYY